MSDENTPDDGEQDAETATAPEPAVEAAAPVTHPGGAADDAPVSSGTPWHIWVVGIAAILWNSIGAFDYTATQLRLESYLSQFTAEQLEYYLNFPIWAESTWAIAIWSAMLGSFLILFRKSWAVWAFALSLIAMFGTFIYNYLLTNGLEIAGLGGAVFSAVIVLIGAALLIYSRNMAKAGILR